MGQITDNAIAWAQFRVAGGWQRMGWLALGYAALVVGIAAVVFLLSPNRSSALDVAPTVLLVIQAFMVVGVSVFRSSNVIQRETTSKLMESHRLMPIDPRLAVMGYALGALAMVAPFVAVNIILGTIATAQANLPIAWWFWANGVVLSCGMFASCVAAGGAMLGSGMGAAVFLVLFIAFATGGVITLVAPGMVLLTSPLVDRTVFRAQDVGSQEVLRWVICMAVQLPIAWVIILAGARRFRAGDIPGITGALGSALLVLFVAASMIVVREYEMLPKHVRRNEIAPAQYIGTLIAIMLLGVGVAISHVARHAIECPGKYRGGRMLLRDEGIVVTVVVAAVAFLMATPTLPLDWQLRAAWTVIQLIIAMVTALLWARWCVRRGMLAGHGAGAMALWWVWPLVAGALVGGVSGWEGTFADTLLQISPLAMLPAIWSDHGNAAQPASLLIQLAAPLLAAAFLLRGTVRAGQGSETGVS